MSRKTGLAYVRIIPHWFGTRRLAHIFSKFCFNKFRVVDRCVFNYVESFKRSRQSLRDPDSCNCKMAKRSAPKAAAWAPKQSRVLKWTAAEWEQEKAYRLQCEEEWEQSKRRGAPKAVSAKNLTSR